MNNYASTDWAPTPKPVPTMMGGLLGHLDEHNRMLTLAVLQLEACVERITGPDPQPSEATQPTAQPVSLAQSIEQKLDESERLISRLNAILVKFERIA